MDLTALTLFGRARYKVLACLLPSEALHLREIARRTSLSPTATQYELRVLLQAGLLLQEDRGGRVCYVINDSHPIMNDLRSIIRKMDAMSESETIRDDTYWSKKRSQQAADYKSRDLKRKSPFLSNRRLASSFNAEFGKDVKYDY